MGKRVEKTKSLEFKYPAIAAQWHPTKNGSVKPNMIKPNTKIKYWWHLLYDDPETGKHFEFEWEASPNERVAGNGCPFLSGRAVWRGFNDLASKCPSLAIEWHPTKNGNLKPTDVTCGKNIKVWWYLPYDDPETGKHFDFEWKAWIADRVKGARCPFLTGNDVWPGFNDLATKTPWLAQEWHPWRNGDLRPTDVSCNRHKKVWWLLPYDDPVFGHFDFEWEASPNSRMSGNGCPFLVGQAVWPGYNDLLTRYPDVARQWHPTKNGKITPLDVAFSSNKKYWWLLSYDDPEWGHFDFEWEATVNNRTSLGEGCPFIGNDKVWVGYNDLQTRFPVIASQWHPNKNGKLTPRDVVFGTPKNVWWMLPYVDPDTGKYFEFEWQAPVNIRTGVGTNDGHQTECPFLTSNPKVWKGFNDLVTKAPMLAAQWHPNKNGKLTPDSVTCNSGKYIWWYLPYDDPETGKHFDFEWRAQVNSRSQGVGCPYLTGDAVWKGYNDLESCYTEISKEWHPTKNRKLTPDKVYKKTSRKVWWKCAVCGYEWFGSIKARTVDGVGCKKCRKHRYIDL